MHVVELLVFAGRTNPRFTLPTEQTPRLWAMVRQLAVAASPTPPRLGYQGLVVYGLGADGSWSPWLRVFEGTVTVTNGWHVGIYRDTPGLEDWLLGEAERADMGEILDATLPQRRRIQ